MLEAKVKSAFFYMDMFIQNSRIDYIYKNIH